MQGLLLWRNICAKDNNNKNNNNNVHSGRNKIQELNYVMPFVQEQSSSAIAFET
jgi:hypothetical protein